MTDWNEHEDAIDDAISDSIDMDWTSRTGAKAVVAWLNENAAAPAPSSLAGGEALDRFEQAAFAKVQNLPRGAAARAEEIARRDAEYDAARNAILAALSPEAPAREGVSLVLDQAPNFGFETNEPAPRQMIEHYYRSHGMENWQRLADQYCAALTPRHEAPAEKAEYVDAIGALSERTPEAPAEGAGEEWRYHPEPLQTADTALKALDDVDELVRFCSVSMLDTERYYRGAEAMWRVVHWIAGVTPDKKSLNREVPWVCKNCKTDFLSTMKDRVANGFDDHGTGPACPTCKAFGQFTYRVGFHLGDPCIHCGWPHDEVAVGPCSMSSERARSSAPEAREEALGNLLAVIHGDGGHRALEVGVEQAAAEAEKIVARLLSSAPEARSTVSVLAEALHDRMFGVSSLKDPALALAEISDGGGLHEAAHELLRALPPRGSAPEAREDYGSLIAARCVALPGKLIDCPVCLAVDNERDRQAAPSADKLRIAVEALEPFANLGVSSGPDDEPCHYAYRITRGAIRNARQALAALKGDAS